jgi:hypothetical protein
MFENGSEVKKDFMFCKKKWPDHLTPMQMPLYNVDAMLVYYYKQYGIYKMRVALFNNAVMLPPSAKRNEFLKEKVNEFKREVKKLKRKRATDDEDGPAKRLRKKPKKH